MGRRQLVGIAVRNLPLTGQHCLLVMRSFALMHSSPTLPSACCRFVQKLRQSAASQKSVTVRQGYVRRLINGGLGCTGWDGGRQAGHGTARLCLFSRARRLPPLSLPLR